MRWRTPWQISACLTASNNSSELLEMAAKAERGELGDIDEWLQAEDRWSNNGLTELDFLYSDSVTLPFNHEIGKRGFPFSESIFRYINSSSNDNLDFLSELVRVHSSLVTTSTRNLISRSILNLLREYSTRKIDVQAMLPFDKIEEIINELVIAKNYFFLEQLDFILTSYKNEHKVIELIDFIGKESNLFVNSYYSRSDFNRFKYVVETFAIQFTRRPELVGVLRLISLIELEYTHLQEAIPTIPKSLLETTRFSNLDDKESAAIISLVRGDISLDDIKLLADLAAKSTSKCSRVSSRLLKLIRKGKFSSSKAETLLVELSHTLPPADYDCFRQTLKAANELLSTRTSNLGNSEVYSQLGLPVGLGKLIVQFSEKPENL